MSTFSLHKTNPRLTGNFKIVLDSENNVFIESINSTQYLSRIAFKGYEYNENLSYGTNIRNFCKQFTNLDSIYDITDESLIGISDSLGNQHHQLYNYGCYSEESQLIDENLRFFAPLHIDAKANDHPELFVVLKVDAATYSTFDFNNDLSTWINRGTIVQVFDLEKINQLIFRSIEDSNIDIDFDESSVIAANGLNLRTGLYNRTEEFSLNQLLENETTITEFENWITNTFKRHNLIYSNIVNLEFAFTDPNADNRFTRYVGLYVKKNQISLEALREYENSGALRLMETQFSFDKFDNSMELSTFQEKAFSRFANSFRASHPALIEFNFSVNPQRGQLFQLTYQGISEFIVFFDDTLLGDNATQTKLNLIDQINNNYQGENSTVTATLLSTGWIRIESNSALTQFENLKLTVPTGFKIKQPIYSSTPYQNTFIGSNNRTISLNDYINPEQYGYMMYKNSSNVEVYSKINRVYQYKGDYFYQLDDAVDHDINPDHVWFVQEKTTQPILCSLIEHRAIDFDQSQSIYDDILDFDIELYKKWLVSQLNRPVNIGSALEYYGLTNIEDLTEQQLIDYKVLLDNQLNKFFNSIDLNRKYLFNQIDLLTSEATVIDNEYDRLNEQNNLELRKKNRLYQFINKWSYDNGTDVYANPYRLNIALPFRVDSFLPSQNIVDRDIRYHTHSWYVIAEGQNPYYDINDSTIQKHLGYTRYPITSEMLKDQTIDAYESMIYQTDTNKYFGWSDIYYDEIQDACYTFFRGVLYRFETNNLDGYRFAVVIKTSEPITDDVYKINYYKNDQFKTLTLVINFYVPDPILTSLEQGDQHYYLDRSLLYFSNEIYASSAGNIDFGTDRISVRLYDTTSAKRYLNQIVTNNWFFDNSGDPILYVGRGDSSVFNVAFADLLSVGDDFEISYTSSDNINSPFYGMYIRFYNIVEVGIDHFWCKKIEIQSVKTYDPDGINDLDINDNIVDTVELYDVYAEYVANNNIFNENNTIYISRAIAYENCIYTKIISSSVNNARYKEISLSNIKNFVNANAIKINDQNDQYLKAQILPSAERSIVVNLQKNGNQLSTLSNAYVFPILRYSGKYRPQTKLIFTGKNDDSYDSIFPSNRLHVNEYKLNVSKNVSNDDFRVVLHEDFIPATNLNQFYSYIRSSTGNNIVSRELPWIVYPKEHRHICSLVFNSQEQVKLLAVHNQGSINLVESLRSLVKSWVNIDVNALTDQTKFDLLKLYYDTVDETINDFDIEALIIDNFITTTFLKIYRLDRIETSSGTIVQFNIDRTSIQLLTIPEETSLNLTFIR